MKPRRITNGEIYLQNRIRGNKKLCNRCGMLLTGEWEHRRSRLNPKLCDSCGGDDLESEDLSPYSMDTTSTIGQVGGR